ncbi:MAG: hypothetical protein A2V67_08660 [Deltaproteobacteria bacterium RBG_13_61_14]|nr:MAG: hypothetical protein A2V67_08660 [Deltaproteobacteria bacterium RBG_13_61_14]
MAAREAGKPEVSILILTRNEEQNIGVCLTAVFGQETRRRFEVIVVDSGSTDRTLAILENYPVRLFQVAPPEFNHGRARQFASEQAEGEFLVYLVADAMPADAHWLERLVDAVAGDPAVAGAYSRQLPRPDADPIEAVRVRNKIAGSEKRREVSIQNLEEFDLLSPAERLALADFEDVSACRRRSVWQQIPIQELYWAEDLAWSLEALRAGHKIVFEPESQVIHSHRNTMGHSFRRGYVDQMVAKEWFGLLYYADSGELLVNFTRLLRKRLRLAGRDGLSTLLRAPLWLLAEVMGNFLAARPRRQRHVAYDFSRSLYRASFWPAEARKRVMLTRFTLGNDPRPVLFMNPNSAAIFRLRVPARAKLCFGMAINPRAWPHRREPVRFLVGIAGQNVFEQEVSLQPGGRWQEGEVDLDPWAGQRLSLSLITRAGNTDHAWAGWGRPRVVTDKLSRWDRMVNRFLDGVHRRVTGTPFRHP